MPKAPPIQRIAIIGFGEAGSIFGNDFAHQGIQVSTFDILFHSRRHRQQMLAKARSCGVTPAESLRDCLIEAELVISAVTASATLQVAKDAGRLLGPGQILVDINSVSPETKRKCRKHVERNQARFVEAAVMAPIPGLRLRVPMLLGGPHAFETAEQLRAVGVNVKHVSDRIGVASAVKMCRSVLIKGLEALAVECLFAARQYGAEKAVLDSVAATYPQMGWTEELLDYLIGRVAEHGQRRAAEMREVARALRAVGIEPAMALATARRQERLVVEMARRKLTYSKPFSWRELADALGCNSPRRQAAKEF